MGSGPFVTEQMVAQLWVTPSLLLNGLRTTAGESLQIVYRGRANDDRGPDFCEALVAFDAELKSGAVEVHIRSSDWYAHGHHRDPYYDEVILHVVLWHDHATPTITAGGHRVPILEVCHYLAFPFDEFPRALSLPSPSPEPCRESLGRLGDAGFADLLREAGRRRFGAKTERFARQLSTLPSQQALYAGILEALGYARNRQPFKELAEGLPIDVVEGLLWGKKGEQRELFAQALMLGAAGLLPSQRSEQSGVADDPAWIGDMERAWRYFGLVRVVDASWQFFRTRPENFPTRRVAGSGLLLARHLEKGLLAELKEGLMTGTVKDGRRALEATLTVRATPHWSHRFDFRPPVEASLGALIGTERAGIAIINVVLPFFSALAQDENDKSIANRAIALYDAYPRLAENSVTRAMVRQLALPKPVQRQLQAREQQGLLHLYRQGCVRGLCAQCPCNPPFKKVVPQARTAWPPPLSDLISGWG